MDTVSSSPSGAGAEVKWRPLNPTQRRVIGVLIEKAKTTPDLYPLTLNALTTGCNQKNNRDPQTNLQPDQVEQALYELRELGAVVEVQAGGRVPKYRHQMYDWLGVDKVELSVMAEFFLRGPQTWGELRSHVSRMETMPDLSALRQVVQALQQKNLVMELTPEGRGQVITHTLYKDRELADLRERFKGHTGGEPEGEPEGDPGVTPRPRAATSSGVTLDMFSELRVEVAELRAEVARLRNDVREMHQSETSSPPTGESE